MIRLPQTETSALVELRKIVPAIEHWCSKYVDFTARRQQGALSNSSHRAHGTWIPQLAMATALF